MIAGGGLAAQRAAESLRALRPRRPADHARRRAARALRPAAALEGDPRGRDADLSLRPRGLARRQRRRAVDVHAGDRAGPRQASRPHAERRVPYDELLIATGATPVTLPGLPHAQALRTLDDALELAAHLRPGARIAVVGAGLIGQEIASAAAARQAQATLIDVATRPFDALVGPGQGDWLRARHEQAGVELLLGRRLTAAAGRTLILDDGTRVTADRVVVAIGVCPDMGWAGLRTLPRGVHAAGDCTGSAHWEAAVRQGQDAARAILGLPPKPEAPPLVWSDQHGARIQRLGDPANADHVHRDGDDTAFTLTFTRRGRPIAATLVNRPGDVAKARRGLQIQAKEAA